VERLNAGCNNNIAGYVPSDQNYNNSLGIAMLLYGTVVSALLSYICKPSAKVLKIFEIHPNAVQNYQIDAQSFCVTVKNAV